MDTIFMNCKNSETSEALRILLNLADKMNLKRSDKYVTLLNLSMYYTWKKFKNSYKNNKLKISGPTWNEKIDLPDRLHSLLDIPDYFEYFIKKHGKLTDNPPIKIYSSNT